MKIAFKRRNFFILVSIIVVLSLFSWGSYRFIIARSSHHSVIRQYCNEFQLEIEGCEVFISDRFENELGEDCFSFILPLLEENKRQTNLCFSKGLLNWDNPYPNYELLVPIKLSVRFNRNFLFGNKIKSVNFDLMDEDRAYEIVDPINSNTSVPIRFWTPLVLENNNRGYYFTKRVKNELVNDTTFKTYDVLGVKKVRINSPPFLEKGVTKVNASLHLEGKYYEEDIVINDFILVTNSVSEPNRFEEMTIDGKEDIGKILTLDKEYKMQLTITDQEKIDEQLISRYINSEEELEFVLKYVIIENEN